MKTKSKKKIKPLPPPPFFKVLLAWMHQVERKNYMWEEKEINCAHGKQFFTRVLITKYILI